jgi:DtxR family Mn-dependent transcriptional regulator
MAREVFHQSVSVSHTDVPLTPAMEDYLRAIVELQRAHGQVTNRDLAHHLGIAEPSVTQMVRRLVALGLIEHAPRACISCSQHGAEIGAELEARFATIRFYLADALGFDLPSSAVEADRIEHAVSITLVQRMAARERSADHDDSRSRAATSANTSFSVSETT